MRTPWEIVKSWAAALRGEDPQRQVRWVSPYAVAGVNMTADQSMSLSTVWACIDIIAKSIASCQWNIYEPLPNTNRRRILDDDMRAWMLNTRPNPEMTAIGFREALLFQAIPFGNAYAEIVRDAAGRVVQLWPLMSDRMMPRRNPDTWELEYHYLQPNGDLTILASRRVFHLRGPGLWGLMGENIIARAAKTLGVAAAQERFSGSYFGQGAQPTGVLEFAGKLSDEQYMRLKQDWADKHKGPDNAHKPLILESGMKFTPISIDPQKSQLTEDKKFSVEEICRWFGVPPHKVQHLEHATFSNIEHSSIEFVRDALTPWSKRLCQEADAKLFDQNRGPWKTTEIDLRPLTYGDAQSRALAQASWRQNGIMSANEIRAQEGLDDCGAEGDVLLVQQNMTTVQKLLNDAAASEVEPPDGPEDDEEDVLEDDLMSVKQKAVKSALFSALSRYTRRVANRAAALEGKSGATAMLREFKASQHTVLISELEFFDEFVVDVFGRKLGPDDMARLVAMHERGDEMQNFFPHAAQLSTRTEKVDP